MRQLLGLTLRVETSSRALRPPPALNINCSFGPRHNPTISRSWPSRNRMLRALQRKAPSKGTPRTRQVRLELITQRSFASAAKDATGECVPSPWRPSTQPVRQQLPRCWQRLAGAIVTYRLATARRRGDRIEIHFAAVHESLFGTFETCRRSLKMSAYRGTPEVIGTQSE